jgi:4-hydroxy-2-oxoglutarate aldolase
MKLTGVMPPITTPFTDGDVALDRLKENFEKWNRTELSGYLVLGSNGETVYLNEKERLSVVETSREAIPSSKLMLVGTGMESTRETIRFSSQVATIGADYALVVTPSYFKTSMTPQVLYDHFTSIADSSQIGVLLYNVPKFTGVNLEPDLVARLSAHPNIVGIKDSSGNIGQLGEIISLCPEGFAVFTGSAPVLFPALCVGAAGGIVAAANAVPQEFCRIRSLFQEGKHEQARELQNRLTPLAKAVTVRYGIGGLKIAMDLAGYFGGEPRAPLQKPGTHAKEELEHLLAEVKSPDGA